MLLVGLLAPGTPLCSNFGSVDFSRTHRAQKAAAARASAARNLDLLLAVLDEHLSFDLLRRGLVCGHSDIHIHMFFSPRMYEVTTISIYDSLKSEDGGRVFVPQQSSFAFEACLDR